MLIVLLFLLILMFLAPPFSLPNRMDSGNMIHSDYLSLASTEAIKGFFVVLVFCSHYLSYVELPNVFVNVAFVKIIKSIGQLMVAPFFFYSGYGLYVSVRDKGHAYIQSFFRKRFLPLWLYFAFCIVLYYILALMRGRSYSPWKMLLVFTGWIGIGNSNWFLFDTFIIYLLVIFCFSKLRILGTGKTIVLFAGSVCLFILFLKIFKEPWWYNTLLCYPCGLVYGYYKKPIDRMLMSHFWKIFSVILLSFYIAYRLQQEKPILYCLYSVIFVIIVAMGSTKIKCSSYVCSFLGRHVFGIYIIQKLFFIMWSEFFQSPYILFVIAFISTVLTAVVLDHGFARLKALISGSGVQSTEAMHSYSHR